jgi:hypothetical protein
MSTIHQWRRRRSAVPLLLTIVDHDTRRFSVEGPVLCDEPWVTEVSRAQKAGRKIEFLLVGIDQIDGRGSTWDNAIDYDEWPPRSIIWF